MCSLEIHGMRCQARFFPLAPKLCLEMLPRSSASRVARRERQVELGRRACPSRAWVRAEIKNPKGTCPVENKRHPCLMSHPWCLGGSLGVSGIERLSESSLHSRTGHVRWVARVDFLKSSDRHSSLSGACSACERVLGPP